MGSDIEIEDLKNEIICLKDEAIDHMNLYKSWVREKELLLKNLVPAFEVKHGKLDSDGLPICHSFVGLQEWDIENLPEGTILYVKFS